MVAMHAATRPKRKATLCRGEAPRSGTHTSSYRSVAHIAWDQMSALCRMRGNYIGYRYTVKQYNGRRINWSTRPGRAVVQLIPSVGGPHGSRTSLKGMTSGSTAPSEVLL